MIAVVGSINMDLVIEVERLPRPGETLSGRRAKFFPGGKGANQAVAAARLGADVEFFGAVGDDSHGERLLSELAGNGVNAASVAIVPDTLSGLAAIWVDSRGENSITVIAGANARIDRDYVDRHLDRIAKADTLLLQLEIPLDTVEYLLRALPVGTPRVILDPAPARDIGSLPLSRVDVLTPNTQELLAVGCGANPEEAANELLERGVRHVVCTEGAAGATWYSPNGTPFHSAAPAMDVVDATAAGDAFNGALAWALLDANLETAIPWAVTAGALATTACGAQPSLPTIDDLRRLRERA